MTSSPVRISDDELACRFFGQPHIGPEMRPLIPSVCLSGMDTTTLINQAEAISELARTATGKRRRLLLAKLDEVEGKLRAIRVAR